MSDETRRVTIDLTLPTYWQEKHFFCVGDQWICGFVAAISFQSWTLGFEIINGYSRGIAFMIGPLWLGFAALRRPRP